MRVHTIYLCFLLSVRAALSDAENDTVVLLSGSQPCQGPLVFTCTTSQVSPQMRVTVQSPTGTQAVERTISYLHDSDSYNVSLAAFGDGAALNVTIRNVSGHVGTKYRCVQHHDEGTIKSEELVIMNCSSPMAIHLDEHAAVNMSITVLWSAEHDSWSMAVQWKTTPSIIPNNISVTRQCYPSGEGSQELKSVAPTEEMVTFLVPLFVQNCSVTMEMHQGDTLLLAAGSALFETAAVRVNLGSLMEGSKQSSQQFSPLTVYSSVGGGCAFVLIVLILFGLFLLVALRVHYKRKHASKSLSNEELGGSDELQSDESRRPLPSSAVTNPMYAMATSERRSPLQSGSPTGSQYGNPAADGVPLTHNPAYDTFEFERWNRFQSASPTENHYVDGAHDDDEIPMIDNPAYSAVGCTQVYSPRTQVTTPTESTMATPTQSTTPRLAPVASRHGHPNMYNYTNSTSDHEYI